MWTLLDLAGAVALLLGVIWCSPASFAASARTYAACVMTIRNLATLQAEQ